MRARAHPGGSSSSSIAPTVPDVKSTNSIPSNILDEGEERRSRQTETTEEERLLTGVSVSSVLSMHEGTH